MTVAVSSTAMDPPPARAAPGGASFFATIVPSASMTVSPRGIFEPSASSVPGGTLSMGMTRPSANVTIGTGAGIVAPPASASPPAPPTRGRRSRRRASRRRRPAGRPASCRRRRASGHLGRLHLRPVGERHELVALGGLGHDDAARDSVPGLTLEAGMTVPSASVTIFSLGAGIVPPPRAACRADVLGRHDGPVRERDRLGGAHDAAVRERDDGAALDRRHRRAALERRARLHADAGTTLPSASVAAASPFLISGIVAPPCSGVPGFTSEAGTFVPSASVTMGTAALDFTPKPISILDLALRAAHLLILGLPPTFTLGAGFTVFPSGIFTVPSLAASGIVAPPASFGPGGTEGGNHPTVGERDVPDALASNFAGGDMALSQALLNDALAVLVHGIKNLPRGHEEAQGELLVGLGRRALPPVAVLRQILEALREAAVDGLLPALGAELAFNAIKLTLRDAPFINIDLAVAAHVEHAQRPPDGLRPDQKLQVRLAAVLEELDDFFVALLRVHGLDNFVDHERARVVLVHELEHLAGGGEELGRELGDLLARRGRGLGAPLGPRGELGPQRDLDRLLPASLSTGEPRKRRPTSPPPARPKKVRAPRRATRSP